MRDLFETISSGEELELCHVTTILNYIKEFVSCNPKTLNNYKLTKDFPFNKGEFLKCYKDLIENTFNEYKDELSTYLKSNRRDNQIFEVCVSLPNNMADIRYLFDINRAKDFISSSNLKSTPVQVDTLRQFTENIEIDKKYALETENKEPIIMCEYPPGYPGFFIIDGNHRVIRAIADNKTYLQAYIIDFSYLNEVLYSELFFLISLVHLNLASIGLYMVGEIDFNVLTSSYINLVNDKY